MKIKYLTFLIGISLVGAVSTYEVLYSAVNLHGPNTRFDSEIGWSPIPNGHTWEKWGEISLNSCGFRSGEICPDKKQLIILGDSVAWGYGVGDKETVSHYLNQALKPFNYQVSNLAVPGYSVDQYYLFLKRHIGKFKNLHYVILILCTQNDFYRTLSNEAYGKRKPLYTVKGNEPLLTGVPISRLDLRNFLSVFRIIRKLSLMSNKFSNFLDFLTDKKVLDPEEGQKVFYLLLKKIDDITSENNAKLIIITSPSRHDFPEKSPKLIWFEEFFLAKGGNYRYIDYYEVLRSHSGELDRIYGIGDPYHYSSYGNKLLSEPIAKYINTDGLLLR